VERITLKAVDLDSDNMFFDIIHPDSAAPDSSPTGPTTGFLFKRTGGFLWLGGVGVVVGGFCGCFFLYQWFLDATTFS